MADTLHDCSDEDIRRATFDAERALLALRDAEANMYSAQQAWRHSVRTLDIRRATADAATATLRALYETTVPKLPEPPSEVPPQPQRAMTIRDHSTEVS